MIQKAPIFTSNDTAARPSSQLFSESKIVARVFNSSGMRGHTRLRKACCVGLAVSSPTPEGYNAIVP
jgi:hypothetical protein